MAQKIGFSGTDLTVISTAISEVARNIVEYALPGEIEITIVDAGGRQGIVVVARDEGPGIADVSLALQDGYSTGKGLGLGLPGARRLMDEFEIRSEVGKGTTVVMKKWRS
ncbi:MAG: ATP-binding protein [Acidobacteria bacterium]|nr:ATP-binding protein [Acidobacteriota bacterium]